MSPPTEDGAVVVDGVRKCFGQQRALDGVTFTVPEGQVFGLMGGNGSGKSVMLRILATLLPPDEGRATVAGHSVADESRRARAQIGYVPDDFGVYERLTVEEVVELYAGVHGLRRSGRRQGAGEVLEVVGLADRRHDDAAALSRGDRQRLGLAGALVHDPPVVLLDEPTAGLDARGAEEVGQLISGLGALGKTVLITGRCLDRIGGCTTRMGLLEQGRMVLTGPTADVFDAVTGRLASAAGATA